MYQRGVAVLEKLLNSIVMHMCYAVGSVQEPAMDELLLIYEEMRIIMSGRAAEDKKCIVGDK